MKSRMNKEDSGIIDLKALLAEAEKQEEAEGNAAIAVAAHIPVYPFGSPPEAAVADPSTKMAVSARGTTRAGGSRSMRLGAVAIAAVILGVSAMAAAAVGGVVSLQTPHAAQSSTSTTTLQWAIASSIVALDSSEPAIAPSAPAEPAREEPAADNSGEAPRAAKTFPHIAKAPVVNRTEEAPKEAPATKQPAAPPASDPCNGDLMCAMQRAVKK
jgi:hypothetical protein